MKRAFFLVCMICVVLPLHAAKLPLLQVDGKNFVTPDGKTVVLHGLAFSDPDKLANEGHWNKKHFQMAAEWQAQVVRFAVHPSAWRERGEKEYLKLLDKGIKWATKYNMYVIIDWHSIGNLATEKFQAEMYNTTIVETNAFWQTISERYAGNSTVAFYEIFNEPTQGGRFGDVSWEKWQQVCGDVISTIRKNDEQTIVLVAGFNWAYDLTPVKEHPFTQANIAYVAHPYPQKRNAPWEDQWLADWGFVAETAPVFLTELGFLSPDDPGAHIPCIGDETYGNALIEFCKEKGISWMPWCFDPSWHPVLFTDWDYTPSWQGKFFKAALQAE